jgi:hypothetical protein
MANDDDTDPTPRQEFDFSLTTVERGKITVKLLDRINIDDVYLHMVNREVFRIITGVDTGDDINPLFKDFLLRERFTAGQN